MQFVVPKCAPRCPALSRRGLSEYVTATEPMPPSNRTEGVITSAQDCEACCEASTARGVSARVEGLMKARSEYASAVEFEIDASQVHWSQCRDAITVDDSDDDDNGESDQEVFSRLHKTYPGFFSDTNWWEEVGEKIAEGGQAEEARLRFSMTVLLVGV